jgi:hypothetical protein
MSTQLVDQQKAVQRCRAGRGRINPLSLNPLLKQRLWSEEASPSDRSGDLTRFAGGPLSDAFQPTNGGG